MYTEYMYQSSLFHHGILGMKWGVMHGPPYPLGYEAHSKKEKKLNPKAKIDGKAETKGFFKKSNKKDSTKTSSMDKEKEKKHLTDKQKKIIKGVAIGAGIAGAAALGAYAYSKNPQAKEAVNGAITKLKDKSLKDVTQNGTERSYIDEKGRKVYYKDPEKSYIIGDNGRKIYTKFSDGTDNPLANKGFSVIASTSKHLNPKTNQWENVTRIADSKGLTHTPQDYINDIQVTNLGSKGYYYGRNHNCISCAINMEMRARGIDSVAKDQPEGKYNFGTVLKTLNLTTKEVRENTYTGDDPKELINLIHSQPAGSRGIIAAPFKKKIGKNDMHFFNYVVDPEGEVHLLDGQQEIGEIDIKSLFTSTKTKRSEKLYEAHNVMLFRTDNRNINYDTVTEFIEPDLGTRYDVSERLAKSWDKGGRGQNMPKTKLVKEEIHGKEMYSLDKNYRRVKGKYEK